MSTLSSTSTYAEILAAYMDSAVYEEDADVAKARAFVSACRMLIRFPSRLQVGGRQAGHEMEIDVTTIRAEMAAAQSWIAANDQPTGGRTTWGNFSNFRD